MEEPKRGYVETARETVTTRTQLQDLLWHMRADTERLVAQAGPVRMELPGAAGDWSLKDVVAHLAAWRWWSVARMEGAVHNTEPTPPWGVGQSEESSSGVDQINEQFHAAALARSVAEVLADSRATLDRLEAATMALSEGDLFTPGRYPWLDGYRAADIVLGSAAHLYEDHEPAISEFLARTA